MPTFKKIRIAVVANAKGQWASCGWDSGTMVNVKKQEQEMIGMAYDSLAESDAPEAVYWINAEIELPEAKEMVATVEKAPVS